MQIKVNASNLCNALDCASVGGGKGFVLMVSPVKVPMGDKEVQVASVSSSNGEKTAMSSIVVHVTGMEEPQVYYVSSSLRTAVASLSKIAETLTIVSKGTYLEVFDEKKLSVVKVELMEKDIIMQLPDSPEGAVLVTMEKEKFVNAIKFGGYCAEESNTANIDDVAFFAEEGKLTVLSRRSVAMCKAEAAVKGFQNKAEKQEWYLVNYKFIQNLCAKLSGDMIQIAFTPKFMVIQTASACFGSKRSDGSVVKQLTDMLDNKEYDYSGKLAKKDLLLAMDIAMVAVKEKAVCLQTNEDNTIQVSSEGNKTVVAQKECEGQMPEKRFSTDVIKLVLGGCGENIHYFGQLKTPFVMFDGEEDGVRYSNMIAPVVQKPKEENKPKDDKKAKLDKK